MRKDSKRLYNYAEMALQKPTLNLPIPNLFSYIVTITKHLWGKPDMLTSS